MEPKSDCIHLAQEEHAGECLDIKLPLVTDPHLLRTASDNGDSAEQNTRTGNQSLLLGQVLFNCFQMSHGQLLIIQMTVALTPGQVITVRLSCLLLYCLDPYTHC